MQESELPITSSVEPSWAPEAAVCYQGVIHTLQQAGVQFAISGGFAFHYHTGIWRTTKDLDLVLTPADAPQALNALHKDGFETLVHDRVWLAKAWRNEYFVDLITGVGNATLTVQPDWIDRAPEGEALGIRCKILGAEEMIASKVFVTRRERFDGSDIAHLVRSCGKKLDWDRLLGLAVENWQMLYWHLVLFAFIYPGRTDAVPQRVWDELTGRFKDRISAPRTADSFRGSLIDPKMFAIDVSEWGERDLYRELWENYPQPIEIEVEIRSKE